MGFSFVSWIVMMSIFVLSVRFFSSCIFVVSPLMFICIIVMVFLEFICCYQCCVSGLYNVRAPSVRVSYCIYMRSVFWLFLSNTCRKSKSGLSVRDSSRHPPIGPEAPPAT